ncbi:hypothetical protein [Vampirovibrio chlorellavorus]|uniref:hypothetical protein n=1 Tax=Vampirovibrio chlorellavorus TaxID=758823 RepID=UPI0026F2737D|nr:hypothetical protein [Vampirovibrio chlorellavorus]
MPIHEVENQLYGHTYMSQPTVERLSRIERTLFGTTQRGNMETRMWAIDARVQQKKAQQALVAQGPLLDYLESKLFQRTYPELAMADRLRRLEVQVFGHAFENYPLPVRMKKLTYAMPLVAKEIRLTQGGPEGDVVVASTRRKSRVVPRTSQKVELVQLDATSPVSFSSPMDPAENLSVGDYSQSIYRDGRGSALRWDKLPIQIYVKGSPAEVSVTNQVVQAWQRSLSLQMVNNSAAADVVVTWDKGTWAQNTTGLLTRPVVQLDQQRAIRTVILINLFPFAGQPPAVQRRALSHQLGHAMGLWGHSEDPDDVMYPAFSQELNDFPSKWAWRSAPNKIQPIPPMEGQEAYAPSQRDINTLIKIYAQPANSLSDYSPY